MSRTIVSCACLLVLSHLAACQIVIPGPLPPDAGPKVQRDAGYGLLLTVLDQESEVGGILAIKNVPPATAKLVKSLAADAKKQSKAIKALAKQEPTITWKSEGLPVPEIEARSWIADRATVNLLTGSGLWFEVELILTQLKASEYITALSGALAGYEPDEARRNQLEITKGKFLGYLKDFRARLETLVTHTPSGADVAASKSEAAPAKASK